MSIYGRILYAVKDTDPRAVVGLGKVIALARACKAKLDLFHAVSTPLFLPQRTTDSTIDGIKRDTIELHRLRLEKLAARARRRGVDVACTAVWDHPPDEAIVRHADETGARLIVAQGHEGGGNRWLMRLTDWDLIRKSDVPVLLLRDPRPYRHPAILAAVDPVHTHDKSPDLDEAILVGGRALAATLRGKLHVVHANHPPFIGLAVETPFSLGDLRSHGRNEFTKLMGRADMAARRGHLVEGDPAKVIPQVAKDIHARIVVMGAVSRTGIRRLLIGNTAERTLGKLPCDVLVVKPHDFRRRVPREHHDTCVLTPAPPAAVAR
jgi:universal stress protein E